MEGRNEHGMGEKAESSYGVGLELEICKYEPTI